MIKQSISLCLLLVSILAISCQKEVSGDASTATNTSSLKGTWKFINLSATTQSIVQDRDGVDVAKTVTTSNYTSINNTGTMTMDGNQMTFTGLSYSIDAIAKGYLYFNNQLEDSLEFPFTFSLPSTNTQTKYRLIGADSIYIEGGALFNTSGGAVTSQGQGSKYRLEGNKLIMTSKAEQSKIENVGGGITRTQQSNATSIVTYQKQ